MIHILLYLLLVCPFTLTANDNDDTTGFVDVAEGDLAVHVDSSDEDRDVAIVEEQDQPSKNAIFYAVAHGDLEAVRGIIAMDDAAVNRIYVPDEEPPVLDCYHGLPAVGDTPLIYAVKTVIELSDAYESRKFSDEHTIHVAALRRINIVSELLFHPKTVVLVENTQGHTALSLAAQAGHTKLANMISSGSHLVPKQTEAAQFKSRLAKMTLKDDVRKRIESEIDALSQKHTSERGAHIGYINALLDLPWDKTATDAITIGAASQSLDEGHYALKKVKDAILEFIAVQAMSPASSKGKILCLVGPPGTGKTSIVQSIANGIKRPLARLSLGGAHDELCIRGAMKSYVSAMPGGILKGLIQAKVNNPVFLLDEIDKIGTGHYNGNPVSALLEALDPEQNHSFMDRYIEIPFDVSSVIFIATANSKRDIPLPLLDRLEIIEVPGYSVEEKIQIAQNHLLPKIAKDTPVAGMTFNLSTDIIAAIIKNYTFEAGVRKLTQHLKTLYGKVVRQYLEHKTIAIITLTNLPHYLGVSHQLPRLSLRPAIGVVNCLAVNDAGGITSFLEVVLVPQGKGKLNVSKVLENDSQNAAEIALAWVRSHAQELGIPLAQFSSHDVHVHKPGVGHVDGPSAGIANVTAMVSAFTQRPCDPSFAMTGELSLTGKVMAIGGVKEKILAAKRVGINKVIIPQENEQDVAEFQTQIEGMEIIPVSEVQDVLKRVLLPSNLKK